MSDNRYTIGGSPAGTTAAALAYGGQAGDSGVVTEEWNKAQNIKTIAD